MTNIPVHERRSRGTAIRVAVLAGAAALVGNLPQAFDSSDPTPPKPAVRNIDYLNTDEMETGIKVAEGETPEEIVQTVNGGRLSGQALLDAENYVNRQGSITETDSSGVTQHVLHRGDIVVAPVMDDQQIAVVNDGEPK